MAHQAGAYPGFRSMKRLGVILLPPGWDASPSQGVLSHSSYDADANQLLTELGWDNLETQRQKLKAEMVYKSLNGLTPNYLSSKFIQRSDVITSYNFARF